MNEQLEREIDDAIARDDYETAVNWLLPFSKEGKLSGGDEIALALLLMWPPLAAWDELVDHIRKALGTDVEYKALCWAAYIGSVLWTVPEDLYVMLENYSERPEACYLIARHQRHIGNYAAAQLWIERALKIETFPKALELAAQLCPNLAESRELLEQSMKGVINNHFELSRPPQSRQELRHLNWMELIRGEYLGFHVWQDAYVRILRDTKL